MECSEPVHQNKDYVKISSTTNRDSSDIFDIVSNVNHLKTNGFFIQLNVFQIKTYLRMSQMHQPR